LSKEYKRRLTKLTDNKICEEKHMKLDATKMKDWQIAEAA